MKKVVDLKEIHLKENQVLRCDYFLVKNQFIRTVSILNPAQFLKHSHTGRTLKIKAFIQWILIDVVQTNAMLRLTSVCRVCLP